MPHRSSTCPIPQRGLQERCPSPRVCVPGSTRSLGRHLKTDARTGEGRWVPICREGRHNNNPTGATRSSTLPSVLATSAAVRRVKAGRAGTIGSSTVSHPQKGQPGALWQGKPGRDKDHTLACPQRCPRRRSVAPTSDRPRGGWLQRSRQGEGREPLGRLTSPTCAARSFARPQDLAH